MEARETLRQIPWIRELCEEVEKYRFSRKDFFMAFEAQLKRLANSF